MPQRSLWKTRRLFIRQTPIQRQELPPSDTNTRLQRRETPPHSSQTSIRRQETHRNGTKTPFRIEDHKSLHSITQTALMKAYLSQQRWRTTSKRPHEKTIMTLLTRQRLPQPDQRPPRWLTN